MIDYEKLLEFEESLRTLSPPDSSVLLYNLELKIDSLRYGDEDDNETCSVTEFTDASLDKLFEEYDFTKDEFTTCSKCGRTLINADLLQLCCTAYIERKLNINSNLERSYWLSFVNSPTTTINTLPNYTQFLCLRQGIPNQIRSTIWQKLLLLNHTSIPQTTKLIFRNFQHSYSAEISVQISKDLNRTFPTVNFFRSQEAIDGLLTILNVYANYDAELGYCQGLLFLVGVLYYQFKGDAEMTLHALITIMESETELHDIFTTSSMCSTLNKWYGEFLYILKETDEKLYDHLTGFVELQSFLFQWWLSFISSHSPDLSIVNKVMDFCMLEGWKVGLFKISLGLLVSNKPILMTLDKGDEEVIYQHLLNESKWGNVINDLDLFFGDLLMSWDDKLFLCQKQIASDADSPSLESHPIINKFVQLSLHIGSLRARSRARSGSSASSSSGRTNSGASNQSSTSVFSHNAASNTRNTEVESLYSEISEAGSDNAKSFTDTKSFTDYLKLPLLTGRLSLDSTSAQNQELKTENETLKALLKRSYGQLEDNDANKDLREQILAAIEA